MKKFTTFFLVAGLWLIGLHANALTTRFVMTTGICTTGPGCGVSWATASSDLQGMINASAPGDEVWVAAGTYKPTEMPLGCIGCPPLPINHPNYRTFFIKDGVKLYGGFAGYETALGQRNIIANTTILSGDIDPTDNTFDSYHVVLTSAPFGGDIGVTIDGFTITGGNAVDNFTTGSSSITVNGNVISNINGGGIVIINGTNTIKNNIVDDNSANSQGGGIDIYNGINTLTNNTVKNNIANNFVGGGICLNSGTNTLINNTVLNNISSGFVSGGGGIACYYGTNTFANNVIAGNSGGGQGGGIYLQNGTNTLTNNTVVGNLAYWGGGISTEDGTNTLTNNIFWGNLVGGSATVQGADYYASGSNGNTFRFNILQYNYLVNTSVPYGLGNAATDNFAQPQLLPFFVSATSIAGIDGIHRTADDGLHLLAINAGDPAITTPTTDITGSPRYGVFDMGAYEVFSCPAETTLYVDVNIPNSGNGTTWALAFKSLDAALAVAHCCPGVTTIKVAKGTYKPTKKPYNGCTEMTTTDPRDKTFHIPVGLKLEGGYLTYPSGGATRNYKVHITTLSGDINSDDAVTGIGSNLTIANNAENAYHVVLASAPSGGAGVTIDGFEIKGGNADEITGSFITVSGNPIYRLGGGGVYTYSGTNELRNNTLSGNSALGGGGISTVIGTTTLLNNTLTGNLAGNGGGIFSDYTFLILTRNTLFGNSANNSGGGIYSDLYSIKSGLRIWQMEMRN